MIGLYNSKIHAMKRLKWEQFSDYLFINKRQKRTKEYESTYKSYFNKIHSYFIKTYFTKNNVDVFFNCEMKDRETATKNKYVTMIRHVAEILQIRDVEAYPYFELEEKHYDTLTKEEIEKLINVKCSYDFYSKEINKRWNLMIRLQLATGVRTSELCNLTWNDINFNQFTIIIRVSKNKTSREIPIPQSLAKEIKTLKRFKHNFLFGSYRGRPADWQYNEEIKKRCLMAGITKHITNYSFRRTFCTNNANDNEQIFKISRIMGHKNIQSTLKYYQNSVEDLREIIEAGVGNLSFNLLIRIVHLFENRLNHFQNCEVVTDTIPNKEIDIKVRLTH